MADKTIGELPQAPQVSDDAMIPLEQQGTAMRMSGLQFAQFAKESALEQANKAASYAAEASDSARSAATSAEEASTSADNAAASAAAASNSEDNAAVEAAVSKTWATGTQNGTHSFEVKAMTSWVEYPTFPAFRYTLKEGMAYNIQIEKPDGISSHTVVYNGSGARIKCDGITIYTTDEGYFEGAANFNDYDVKVSISSVLGENNSAKGYSEIAMRYSNNPPVIRNGTWWTWDENSKSYKDTGEKPSGTILYATFSINPNTGQLIMYAPADYEGPAFSINNNGSLVVTVNG